MSTRILIVYGSTYGQTAKISQFLQQLLARENSEVTVYRGDQLPAALQLASYDAIVVGASLIRERYQKYIEQFVRERGAELRRVPTAFFAVSGSAAGPPAEQQLALEKIKQFCLKTGWQPTLTASLGGAMAFTKYNWLLRWIMKKISQKRGGPTDTSKDHELTNWLQVEEFAHEFSARVRAQRPEGVGV